jgi:uncharacterized damage-inducible protein DinB
MRDPRYPIGPFAEPTSHTAASRAAAIAAIAALPAELRAAVAGLSDARLDTPYRDGGWTVRQVVHHLPDSHLNGYIRQKLALTEDEPTIRPYDENAWSRLGDARRAPPEISLRLLEAVHGRWTAFLRTLAPADFERGYHHPEAGRRMSVDWSVAHYAWHGRHHVAQIAALRTARGW